MKTPIESCLSLPICRYLELKQALGREFANERRVVESVDEFLSQAGSADLTQAEFDGWCKTQLHLSPGVRRNRMRIVRNFCLYRRRIEPNCFVPDKHLFPAPHQSVQPYIFSETEIARLLQAAAQLPALPRYVLRPLVLRLAVVLLYTTGLRRGELLRLTLGDYDPREHTLLIRDTLTLLLRFLAKSRNSDPAALDLEAISPEAVLAFLNYLEQERHNKTSSRNVRLAAIHAFFRYVAIQTPERIEQAQRILSIPFKRTGTQPIDYLEYEEICAVLSSVDRTVPLGRRDYALVALLFNTGARVQEIADLRGCDLQLEPPPQVKLFGKGRKTRICPLWPQTAEVLKEFVAERNLDLRSNAPLFCNQLGEQLTRFGIRYVLGKYCERAVATCPSLATKHLHPHSMRHACAMHLLKSGVDLIDISHWLGHASINTTNRYATADLEMKRQAIARAGPPGNLSTRPVAWRHDASVIEWLASL